MCSSDLYITHTASNNNAHSPTFLTINVQSTLLKTKHANSNLQDSQQVARTSTKSFLFGYRLFLFAQLFFLHLCLSTT